MPKPRRFDSPSLSFSVFALFPAIVSFVLVAVHHAPAFGLAAPDSLMASAPTQTSILLEWQDKSNDEVGFLIERDGVQLVGVAANETSYMDNGLTTGQTYVYRVAATDGANPLWSKKAWALPQNATEAWPVKDLNANEYRVGFTFCEYFATYGTPDGTSDYHWGVDVMRVGDNATGKKKVVTPFSGWIVERRGAGTDQSLERKLGADYVGSAHLQNCVMGAGDVGGWVMTGVQIGEIGDNAYGAYGAHTHIDRILKPFSSLANAAEVDTMRRHFLLKYTDDAFRDPTSADPIAKDRDKPPIPNGGGNPPGLDIDAHLIQFKEDGAGGYLLVTTGPLSLGQPQPPFTYIVKDKVDIVVEVEDPMGHPEKPAIPFKGGYWIEGKTKNPRDVRSAATPYILYRADPNFFSGTTQKTADIFETGKRRTWVWPNDTCGHIIVTNTKGTDGAMGNVDKDQYWYTKAKNAEGGEPNGVGKPAATKAEEAYFPDGRYVVHAPVSDIVKTKSYAGDVWVENFAPAVKARNVQPTPEASGMQLACQLTIEFSESMDTTSVNQALALQRVGGPSVPYAATWDSLWTTISMIATLSPSVMYKLTVNADIAEDLSGGPTYQGALLDSEFGQPNHNGVSQGHPADSFVWYLYGCGETPTGVAPPAPELPVETSGAVLQTALHQNAPNPVGPTTDIRFDLAKAGPVRLEIIGIDGRRIRTLVDAWLPSDRHSAAWNGLTDRGRRVASGVYFYRLTTEREALTRKLLVIGR